MSPPPRIPWFLRPGLWIAERIAGKTLMPARLLAWFPRAAAGSAVFEAFIARPQDLNARLLKLVRLQASLHAGCPFCLDMNSVDMDRAGISDAELDALRRRVPLDNVDSFSAAERAALAFVQEVSGTPLIFQEGVRQAMRSHFTEKQIVVVAYTAAQVNYWARLIQSLGIPPAGFTDNCQL
ncbi:MAG: carboxymuconolactone decarboxylase family protein [Spirochaetia bacterium]|nr:carboxymuconolactone decarboxylase family protein [Spirochaetia bacterium]